jgi:phenylalanyl-tRNA synthetase beta subunit
VSSATTTCPSRRRWRRSPRRSARGAAQRLRRAAHAGRAGLSGNHQLQLCRGALGARAGGQSGPVKLLNPIASQMSVMRSSLLGSLLQVLKFNQDRKAAAGARVRTRPRVPARCAVPGHRHHGEGFHQPMRVAGMAVGLAMHAAMGHARTAARLLRGASGDVEALLAPLKAVRLSARSPGHAPGRCARVRWTALGSASSANCIPSGARPMTWPPRR